MGGNFMTSSEICKFFEFDISVLNRLGRRGLLTPKRKLPTSGKRLYAVEEVNEYAESIVNN